MLERFETVVWIIAGLLWVVFFFRSLIKAKPENLSHSQKWEMMKKNLKDRRPQLILLLVIFIVVNIVFYSLVYLGLKHKFIGQNASFESLGTIGNILIGSGTIALLLYEFVGNNVLRKILRWFMIVVCLLSYFTYSIWGINVL